MDHASSRSIPGKVKGRLAVFEYADTEHGVKLAALGSISTVRSFGPGASAPVTPARPGMSLATRSVADAMRSRAPALADRATVA